MSDVFISYSRCDIDFAHHLFGQTKARTQEPWSISRMHLSSIAMCLFLGSGLESIAQGSGNIKLQNYYQSWSNKYYRLRQQVNLAAFVDYQDNRTTCLEAHGYGMLIYIYVFRLDEDTNQERF